MRYGVALASLFAVACSSPAAEVADAIADALSPDVREASAAEDAEPPPTPAPPTIDEVVCDKQYPGVVGVFAEKAYPGRTKEDLARGTVVNCNVAGNRPPGVCAASNPMVGDGIAIAYCGTSLDGQRVKLIVPPTL